MFEFISFIFQNITFFALHLKNLNSFPKPLSAKKERELLEKMANGDKEARNTLIEHNLRLVSHIVKKYYSEYDEQEDLISLGTVGLIKGIDTFDIQKGARLVTYAARCVENEILMYFRVKKKDSNVVSVNEPIDSDSDGNPLTLFDVIYTEDTISDDIDLKNKIRRLYELVDSMSDEREREILIMRYGLYNTKAYTQREIAQKLDISRSYVSRIEKRVIKDLKDKF